jgi:hypothetical protein
MLDKSYSVEQIARTLGVAGMTVRRDVEHIVATFEKYCADKLWDIRQLEVRRHNNLRRVAWEEWERSREAAESDSVRTREVASGCEGGPDRTETTAQTTRRQQCGDPRYLGTILDASREIAKLLGIYQDNRKKGDGDSGDVARIVIEVESWPPEALEAARVFNAYLHKRDRAGDDTWAEWDGRPPTTRPSLCGGGQAYLDAAVGSPAADRSPVAPGEVG